ncbi:MAG: DUF5666 domain-containing protein [Silicimonas sp.]|nr:DUF5666 domain-containing protein [Silicimonas sp.]
MTSGSPNRRAFLATGASAALFPAAGWGQSRDRDVEGGLGGTGIVGILTETGSLVLAGRRVELDERTRITSPFGRLSPDRLMIGDSLTVEAASRRDGTLIARRIALTWPLVGRIAARDVGGQRLVINGVTIRSRSAAPELGTRVAVSGLWRGNEVIASRLAPAPTSADLISGTVAGRTGRRTIGPVPLRRSAANLTSGGRFATATGRFDPATGELTTGNTEFDRFTGAAGPLKRLAIEGWLEPAREAPGFRISGLGHSFARNLDLARFQDQRMLFLGPYTGRFAADQVVRLPDDVSARRRLLRQISG